MSRTVWIRRDVVLAIHRRQLAEHGGAEGTRDSGLLEFALARPENLAAYSDETPDLAALAAAYAYGIARDRPFVDGNKRTALVVCRTFLVLNKRHVKASREEKYLTFLELAASNVSEEALGTWLRERMVSV